MPPKKTPSKVVGDLLVPKAGTALIAELHSRGGDYNQDNGPYTQNTGGDHNQSGGGGYTQTMLK